ncbi:GntR family transcriptional regulator [Paeniglutamicibacter gangotriensis]|uniref:GntR family transcriptional regulator n=1 Tax=Paeniglutamicibacter gangotriensis Lz1y TaxID=1276920 RepID=M7N6J2_9MICC|nr:GntR family transcriptional regulator [Paeniglutamicibacter gangotriensis]EMQ97379.1 GntR family transcriptional regulator [Paeniglutamicibacter gangotriensis Lz1y]
MATSSLEPLKQESTPAIIARKIRTAIGNGEFGPGAQLGEADLAGRLGVSRGPLREAMQRLTQEGLLVSIRNRGLFVAQFSQADITDIYLTRTAVERGAALKIIEVDHTNKPAGAELLGIVAQMEALGGEPEAISRIDISFHEAMVRLADSPRLTRVHATLVTETKMCLAALEQAEYPLEDRVAEHRRIAQAIIDADVPELHKALADHMDSAIAQLLDPLEAAGKIDLR